MAIREGRWDCPSCGSRGIYGRHVECPGCGKPRPAGIRFYLTDDAPVITDAARLAEARAGADWVCEHCGASNRATVTDCGGCGAPRGSSPGQRIVDYPTAEVPRSGEVPRPAGPLNAAKLSTSSRWRGKDAPAGDRKPPGKGATCMGCGCLGGIVMLALSLLMSLITTCADMRRVGGEDLVPAAVTGKRWERSFLVEQRRVVNGTGWDLPDSAQVVRTERRRRGWGQEVDHYETVTRPVRRTREVQDGTVTRTREVRDGSRTETREVEEEV
ncbi:Ran-binding zinc finger domain-containing protein, partial [Longimicrobium sp.]|uniref:zinc finger Ran-binding domain-containing protein n=1 Tax=Longimicrobium sp. TaxID=2029185 RepID=UPI002E35B1B5